MARTYCLGAILTVCLAWFRLFVGDLSNDVSDDVLSNAFIKYTSFTKARVIRDRLSGKVRCSLFSFRPKAHEACHRRSMVLLLSRIPRIS